MLGRMLRIDRRRGLEVRRLLLGHSLLHQAPIIIPPAAAIDGRCYSGTTARCARRHRTRAGDGDDDFTIIDVDFGRPHEW